MALFCQAEDGIPDIGVTGVQTCALPISDRVAIDAFGGDALATATLDRVVEAEHHGTVRRESLDQQPQQQPGGQPRSPDRLVQRSEERRVGHECRSRWSSYHYDNKAMYSG